MENGVPSGRDSSLCGAPGPCWLPGDLEICEAFSPFMPCASLWRLWAASKKMTFLGKKAALQAKKEFPSPVRTRRSVRTAGVSMGCVCAHVFGQTSDAGVAWQASYGLAGVDRKDDCRK